MAIVVNLTEEQEDRVILELDMGHLMCHHCFYNICNEARYVYEKDHICGNPWTYGIKPVCKDCFATYAYAGNPPYDIKGEYYNEHK